MPPILSVSHLKIAFGNRVVIRDLSFDVNLGDSLAIIGPNGAGKTVLLRALLGLLPYQGTIHWTEDTRLGYVPQKIAPDRQLRLCARDLLEAKIRFLKLQPSELASVSTEAGLTPDLLDVNISILSGGQFQKVLIAFALLGRPNVLLFDEPTASLDELTEERVYESLHALQKARGLSIILVSHDLSVVYRYATNVLCLSKKIPCMGPPRDILTPAMLEELYSAPPKYYQHVQYRSLPLPENESQEEVQNELHKEEQKG